MAAEKKPTLNGIQKLRESLGKEYGTSLTRQDTGGTQYDVISSGSPSLDYAMVVGGYVRGRIHLLWGPEGCGKTTGLILAMAEAQKAFPDLAVAYIDMEQTFDWDWAHRLGLDTSEERMIHLFPESSEDVADMLKAVCRSGAVSMACVDSVGGMVTKKAQEKNSDESDMGKNAQVVTRMCQITAVAARKHKVAVLIVSQVRADFKSLVGMETYAAPKALRHATSMVLKFRQAGTLLKVKIDGDDIPVGKPVAINVERSKVAAGGRKAEWTILNVATERYGPVGIDIADETFSLGKRVSVGAIVQRGSQYDMPDGTSEKGADAALLRLRAEPELLQMVRTKALESIKRMVQPEAESLAFVAGDEPEEQSA